MLPSFSSRSSKGWRGNQRTEALIEFTANLCAERYMIECIEMDCRDALERAASPKFTSTITIALNNGHYRSD